MRLNMKMGMVVSRERLEGERWWWLGVMTNITSGHTGGAPLSIGGTLSASIGGRDQPLLPHQVAACRLRHRSGQESCAAGIIANIILHCFASNIRH